MNRNESIAAWNGETQKYCEKKYKKRANIVLNVVKYKTRSSIVAFASIIILGAIHVSAVEAVPAAAASVASSIHAVPSVDSQTSQISEDKRAVREYNFGLGKRVNYDTPLSWRKFLSYPEGFFYRYGSNAPADEHKEFSYFGAKRSKPARFNFGLGKRSQENVQSVEQDTEDVLEDNSEDNSLDKRAAGRYQFGIGKRAPAKYSGSDFDDYIKRRYSFGLGKR